MSKVNVKASLQANKELNEVDVKGILNGNKLTYKEDNITVTILLDNNKIMMRRVCSDYSIELNFELNKKTNGNFKIESAGVNMELSIETKTLEIKENELFINYIISSLYDNNEMFIFKLKYEVVE